MKKLMTFCVLFFIAFSLQAQDRMDAVTAEICECLEGKDFSTMQRPEANQLVEECITKASISNLDFFMEGVDTENTGPDELQEIMRKKGEAIGIHAAQNCPAFMELMTVIARVEEGEDLVEEEQKDFLIIGKLTSVNQDDFLSINLKETDGREHKLYWMQHFEGAVELKKTNKSIIGKSVEISYKKVESYNPKLEDYAPIKVITGITWN